MSTVNVRSFFPLLLNIWILRSKVNRKLIYLNYLIVFPNETVSEKPQQSRAYF